MYSSGSFLTAALILNQNPFFEIGSIHFGGSFWPNPPKADKSLRWAQISHPQDTLVFFRYEISGRLAVGRS